MRSFTFNSDFKCGPSFNKGFQMRSFTFNKGFQLQSFTFQQRFEKGPWNPQAGPPPGSVVCSHGRRACASPRMNSSSTPASSARSVPGEAAISSVRTQPAAAAACCGVRL
jgi:hypothetical protein